MHGSRGTVRGATHPTHEPEADLRLRSAPMNEITHLVALVRAGALSEKAKLVERPDDHTPIKQALSGLPETTAGGARGHPSATASY